MSGWADEMDRAGIGDPEISEAREPERAEDDDHLCMTQDYFDNALAEAAEKALHSAAERVRALPRAWSHEPPPGHHVHSGLDRAAVLAILDGASE